MKTKIACRFCGKESVKKTNPNIKPPDFCDSKCYGFWRRGRYIQRKIRLCSIEGCKKIHYGKTYCKLHYTRIILGVKEKPTKHGFIKKCLYCGNFFKAHYEGAKYCSSHCWGQSFKKPFIVKKGYKKILIYNHPRADGKGYVFEHIIIVEAKLGRPLAIGEVVHHVDRNKLNNHPDNLIVFSSNADHIKYHTTPSCIIEK